MERVLVVVFNNESKAYEAQSALRQLELQGDISIYADAVVVKHADGTVSVKQQHDFGPRGTLLGTSLGSLIGLLGGPAGVALGAVTGLAIGGLVDVGSFTIGADFVDEVSKSLTPSRVAVIAQIDETWTTPVDTNMEALGGVIFRRSVRQVQDDIDELQIAAMEADLAQLKEEASQANADRKAKLQKKVAELEVKIDAQQAKLNERHQAFEARQQSKEEVLKKNAAAAGRALKELANTPV